MTALVRHYMGRALHLAGLITRDSHAAEDAVAEALLSVWRYARTYDPSKPLLPWLDTIVARCALRIVRSSHRCVPVAEVPSTASAPQGLDDEVERRDLQRGVVRAVSALPVAQRTAVVLRYAFGMTDAEIAGLTATPLGTVKWRLATAKRRLRRALHPVRGGVRRA